MSVAGCFAAATGLTIWAIHRSAERTACYVSAAATATDSCGEPSFIERKMAHDIAHVDY
ncbi:MAG: hypothetical protein CBCREVIR_3791 [Candidatus Burkholderia crenata]|nr:MAG: hypothetical protein CBCREVIR_3791 [Candidatus Burkholderia crenata]